MNFLKTLYQVEAEGHPCLFCIIRGVGARRHNEETGIKAEI